MNDEPGMHEPSKEFTEFLARDIVRTLRHDERFGSATRGGRARRVGLIAASLLFSTGALVVGLVFGASTGYASARIEMARTPSQASGVMPAVVPMPAPTPTPTLLRNIPVKRALAATCNAFALSTPVVEKTPVDQAQPTIPTIDLPPATAKTTERLGTLYGIRQLSSGKLLVDDGQHRQLRLFDSTLASSTVALDSGLITASSYGSRPMPILPFFGDSSLLPDNALNAMRVLDGRGQIVRSVTLPSGAPNFAAHGYTDDRGRLLYAGPPLWREPGGVPDSTPIVRVDLQSGRVDTVARIRNDDRRQAFGIWLTGFGYRGRGASEMPDTVTSPGPAFDDWAVRADGWIALVRGRDYHIDWVRADGTTSATPRLPFDGKTFTADEVKRLDDSTRGSQPGTIRIRGVGTPLAGGRADSGVIRTVWSIRPYFLRDAALISGYPLIRPGAAIADLDGNLWLLPPNAGSGPKDPLTYDMVNAKGELFQRVRMPAGRSVAGFGKGGVVYLVSGDRASGFTLERTRVGGR